MKQRTGWLAALASTALLASGCDQPTEQETAAAQAPAVEALADTTTDETGDCGSMAQLLAVLPQADVMDGMSESYRGCDSPVTANLQYESDRGSLTYTLSILDAELAELPEGREYWQSILDVNRESMASLLSAHRSLADEAGSDSASVTLDDGTEAVLFSEGGEWSLLAMPQSRYALRLDLEGDVAADPASKLQQAAAALDLKQLP